MDSFAEAAFGELLQRFRRRKGLTQKQLASRIGASRNSISYWERGEFLPEVLSTVLELARVLDLSEEERRLLVEARFGTASVLPLHHVPSERNPYFTGREAILEQLHKQVTEGKAVALSQAITGLGGIGKTQVALEYAYRYQERYHDGLWIVAETRETLITSYMECAKLLRLREQHERDQGRIVEAVKRWLRQHRGWLLILDNIEDLALVREFVPAPRQGAVVLTTRRQETGPIAQALVLDPLPQEESVLLLLRRVGLLPITVSLEAASAADLQAAQAIAQALGGLPLALDQAGAYIAETRCSLLDYLDVFKQEQKALLQRRGTVPTDHPQSITTTFALAFEQVQQKNEIAIELLKLCAFLAPEAIPLEVITEGAPYLGTTLSTIATDMLRLDHALEILQMYSLVQRDGGSHTLSIHRLVQAVLKTSLEEMQQGVWATRVLQAVNATFPEVQYGTWPQCERLLPQAVRCAQLVEQYHLLNEEAASLLGRLGQYLDNRAQYSEAEPLLRQALAIREVQLGPEHPKTARALRDLAMLYRSQGKYRRAETLLRQVLAICEPQLGPEHPHTADHCTTWLSSVPIS